MTRMRVVPGVLAAVATFGVALSLLVLFTPPTWMASSMAALAVVALTGMVMRRVTRWSVVITLVQVCLGTWVVLVLQLPQTLFHGLPSPASGRAVLLAATSSLQTIRDQAAPVRTTAELTLMLTLILLVVGIAMDLVAVTHRHPAAAGLILLTAYVAVAANSGTGLAFTYFLVPAAAWVALLAHDGVRTMARWSPVVARAPRGAVRDLTPGLWAWARRVALGALAAAVLLPAVTPHLPTTFLADGLGRTGSRSGAGDGVALADSLAVARSLGDRSTAPILRFETDDPLPPPLRVDVLTTYADGVWVSSRAPLVDTDGRLPAGLADGRVERTTATATVTDNVLERPQVALPGTPTGLDLPARAWRLDGNGIVRLVEPADEYTVTYEEITPTADLLRDTEPVTLAESETLTVDEASAAYVRSVLATIAPDDLAPIDAVQRIQAYLRSAQFTYSLRLADPIEVDGDGRPVPPDPLSQFLASRRGYCIQFSTAMAMMARHRGIPARVGIGFLPGTVVDGTRTVVAADAHAWPELLFPGVGWVRFEPTPGVRSGVAPTWSTSTQVTSPTPTAIPSPTASIDREPVADAPPPVTRGPGLPGAAEAMRDWLAAHVVSILTGLAALLVLAATPLAGRLRREAALRRARDDADRVEVHWQSMLDGLGDIGIRPGAGQTPRQAGATLRHEAYLDEPAARSLDRVVATVERARYAAPGALLEDIGPDADLVVHNAQGKRRHLERLRALLWPMAGRRAWRALASRLTRPPSDQSR